MQADHNKKKDSDDNKKTALWQKIKKIYILNHQLCQFHIIDATTEIIVKQKK